MIVRNIESGDGSRYTIGLSFLEPGPARAAGFAEGARMVVAVELVTGAVMLYGSTFPGEAPAVYRCHDSTRRRPTRDALAAAADRFLASCDPRTPPTPEPSELACPICDGEGGWAGRDPEGRQEQTTCGWCNGDGTVSGVEP